MPFLQKKTFCSQPPKNTIVAFIEICLFHVFIFSLFLSPHLKKTKNAFLDTSTICKNNCTSTHYLWFLRYLPKHYKAGKTSKDNFGPSFDASLDQVLISKNPNVGPSFDSTTIFFFWKIFDHCLKARRQILDISCLSGHCFSLATLCNTCLLQLLGVAGCESLKPQGVCAHAVHAWLHWSPLGGPPPKSQAREVTKEVCTLLSFHLSWFSFRNCKWGVQGRGTLTLQGNS